MLIINKIFLWSSVVNLQIINFAIRIYKKAKFNHIKWRENWDSEKKILKIIKINLRKPIKNLKKYFMKFFIRFRTFTTVTEI